MNYKITYSDEYLAHHGILGMKWGIRRYRNEDGSLTAEGLERYRKHAGYYTNRALKNYSQVKRNRDSSKKDFDEAIREIKKGRTFDRNIRMDKKNKARYGYSDETAKRTRNIMKVGMTAIELYGFKKQIEGYRGGSSSKMIKGAIIELLGLIGDEYISNLEKGARYSKLMEEEKSK